MMIMMSKDLRKYKRQILQLTIKHNINYLKSRLRYLWKNRKRLMFVVKPKFDIGDTCYVYYPDKTLELYVHGYRIRRMDDSTEFRLYYLCWYEGVEISIEDSEAWSSVDVAEYTYWKRQEKKSLEQAKYAKKLRKKYEKMRYKND